MENNFVQNMSNEEAAALPVVSFGGRIAVVDSPGKIGPACDALEACPMIGFDTETRPTFKPGALNKVALLQLSTPDCCYLFRLCRIPLDKRIIHILENKQITKIGADIANDLRALQQLRHFKPDGFIDLQSIVSQWGIAEKSVRKMAGIVLGKRVSKAQRLSNWEAAGLTPAQQSYAATDAWVCLEIYDALRATDQKPLPPPPPKEPKEREAKPARKTKPKKRFFSKLLNGKKEARQNEGTKTRKTTLTKNETPTHNT